MLCLIGSGSLASSTATTFLTSSFFIFFGALNYANISPSSSSSSSLDSSLTGLFSFSTTISYFLTTFLYLLGSVSDIKANTVSPDSKCAVESNFKVVS
jgi:hypothetical protein